MLLRKFNKNYFSILATDKIFFFGSGTVAYPSAVKLSQNFKNVNFITHYTP
jgi:acetylornithine/succinyldiaminopimelate/putrescine aminotransferase